MDQKDIMSHASTGMLKFCGSLLVLAISLKVVGIDFEPIFRAYSLAIEADIAGKCELIDRDQELEDLDARLSIVEDLSHKPGPNQRD